MSTIIRQYINTLSKLVIIGGSGSFLLTGSFPPLSSPESPISRVHCLHTVTHVRLCIQPSSSNKIDLLVSYLSIFCIISIGLQSLAISYSINSNCFARRIGENSRISRVVSTIVELAFIIIIGAGGLLSTLFDENMEIAEARLAIFGNDLTARLPKEEDFFKLPSE